MCAPLIISKSRFNQTDAPISRFSARRIGVGAIRRGLGSTTYNPYYQDPQTDISDSLTKRYPGKILPNCIRPERRTRSSIIQTRFRTTLSGLYMVGGPTNTLFLKETSLMFAPTRASCRNPFRLHVRSMLMSRNLIFYFVGHDRMLHLPIGRNPRAT